MVLILIKDKINFLGILNGRFLSSIEVPAGVHNSFVVAIMACFFFLIFRNLVFILKLHYQIMNLLPAQAAFYFDGAGSFSKDFVRLFRTHFNQIIRRKRIVPPVAIPRINVMVSIDPESLQTTISDGKPNFSFSLDASTPCVVQLFWGVRSASFMELINNQNKEIEASVETPEEESPVTCSRTVSNFFHSRRFIYQKRAHQPLLEMESMAFSPLDVFPFQFFPSDFVGKSSEYLFQEGRDLKFQQREEDQISMVDLLKILERDTHHIPVEEDEEDISSLERNDSTEWTVPLVIVATTVHTPRRKSSSAGSIDVHDSNIQISLIKMRIVEETIVANVIKQIVLRAGNLECHEAFDVYGLENEEEKECLICMTNPKDTMLLPCRHCLSCFECLQSLRQERCPICRTGFTGFVTFPFKKDETQMHDSLPPPPTVPSSLSPPLLSSPPSEL
ncbi:hypothetical protein IE077_000916 [Cardiosporidium cionae]|uniref:RING-type domain-containing protein n=1 Tax=Cardiosporidium cionae TaxID=476202 RepID=A0ABQ7J738_9APIC|nr:hypothetical protein IE077_000916 [Cardiosporidium cionae]|eukprot:KAF8819505.1 hypothetical protein IE077_000916 [Cardiosporidium cionae]